MLPATAARNVQAAYKCQVVYFVVGKGQIAGHLVSMQQVVIDGSHEWRRVRDDDLHVIQELKTVRQFVCELCLATALCAQDGNFH